jgi:hypothetical protein
MKKRIVILFVAVCSFSLNSDKKRVKHGYKDEKITCTYETSNGRIDGNYSSFYKNGQKKSEGTFQNNYRIGKWTVWDSTGIIRMQRVYENPFAFKQIIPAYKRDSFNLLNERRYTLRYNFDGYIDYFNVKEKTIQWSKRIWRFIPEASNENLFENNLLYNIFQSNILSKMLTAFSDEQFFNEITPILPDTTKNKVIGYRIKEDCFFDSERVVAESRIIGISSVIINKLTNDTTDLFWIYFPQVRKYLARQKIQSQFSNISTLDDLFFFRDFNSQIYKEANIWDREISDYKKGIHISKEAESIEVNIIESEHDLWIASSK